MTATIRSSKNILVRSTLGLVGLLFAQAIWVPPASAWEQCRARFAAIYGSTPATCQNCHTGAGGGSPWNAYGIALRNQLVGVQGDTCFSAAGNIDAAINAIANGDADGFGGTNVTEAMAGTQPGWCDTGIYGSCSNRGFLANGADAGAATPPAVTLDPANTPPTVEANGPYAANQGVNINFSSAGTTDAETPGSLSYNWNFGDATSSTQQNPTKSYASGGVFNVTLTVTDPGGHVVQDTATATINGAPVANAGGPYNGLTMTPFMFDGTGTSDGEDANAAMTFDWDFGDGQMAMNGGETPSNTYAAAGMYNVTLTVTDTGGLQDVDMTTINITVAPVPILSLTTSASTGIAGVGAMFDYIVTADNTGTGGATGVVVTNNLPADVTYVMDDCGAGPPAGQVLTWNLGNLAAPGTATCNITVTVNMGAGANLTLNSSMTSNETGAVPADPDDSITVVVPGGTGGVPSIPTLQEWAMILMGLMLLTIGGLRLRRQPTR